MNLKILPLEFAICKIQDISAVDISDEFVFIGKTDEELSLVCGKSHAPEQCLDKEDGWRAFRIEGVLDFSLIGILSQISGILAASSIGIFVVSTFRTDYILVKDKSLPEAVKVLREAGYGFIE